MMFCEWTGIARYVSGLRNLDGHSRAELKEHSPWARDASACPPQDEVSAGEKSAKSCPLENPPAVAMP